ncbi:MAG: hypothetical protein C4341_04770 [Armatimonadota bacterium]
MRIVVALALACLTGCGKDEVPEPTYALLMPESDSSWAREIEAGFSAAAKQFFMKTKTVRYSNEDPESIAEKVGDLDGGPVVVVTLSSDDAEQLAASLTARKVRYVLIGPDDLAGSRAAHVSGAAWNLAYQWKIRWNQMNPRPRNVLLLFGDVPLPKNDIVSAFYRRSNDWTEYRLRVRNVHDAKDEDTDWAETILAVGEDAVRKCLSIEGQSFVPVDGSATALQAVKSGLVERAYVPNYFQFGYRAARLARDAFLDVLFSPVSLQIPFEEVDPEYLPMFLKKRHDIPSIGDAQTK